MPSMQKRIDRSLAEFDWDPARRFITVVELGSLTAAAEAEGLSQSTLSRQMALLEQQLGMTLFERVGRGIQITESGQRLLHYLTVMREAADQVSLTAAGLSQSLAGEVTITVSELDASFRMPAVIKKIRQKAPELQLNILVSNALADLKSREADIGIRSRRPEQADLITRQLANETIDLFGSSDYIDRLRRDKFKGVQIFGFSQLERVIDVLNQNGWQVSRENFSVKTNFQWLQLEMAKAGEGLILLPTDIGNKVGLQSIRRQEGALFDLPVWLVSHRELRTNPRVRFVFDQIVDAMRYFEK